MDFSSKFWKWTCLVILVLGIGTTLGIGLREHQTIKGFEKERLELQDSILFLNKEILKKDQATLKVEQTLTQTNLEHQLEISRIQGELGWTRQHYSKVLSEMSDLDTSELKDYFAERYGQCADTVENGARFLLTLDAGNRIRYDLTDLDFCKEESEIKDSLLLQQSSYIETLDTTVHILLLEKNYFMDKANSFEQQYNTVEQSRANIKAGLDKQRTLSHILGGTAAVLTVGLVTSILIR